MCRECQETFPKIINWAKVLWHQIQQCLLATMSALLDSFDIKSHNHFPVNPSCASLHRVCHLIIAIVLNCSYSGQKDNKVSVSWPRGYFYMSHSRCLKWSCTKVTGRQMDGYYTALKYLETHQSDFYTGSLYGWVKHLSGWDTDCVHAHMHENTHLQFQHLYTCCIHHTCYRIEELHLAYSYT